MLKERGLNSCDYCWTYKDLEVGEACELCGEKKEPYFTQTSSGEYIRLSTKTRERMDQKRLEETGSKFPKGISELDPDKDGACIK